MDIVLGLLIGGAFGASLFLAGLADPNKIIGTLRLKDFHAMRVIAVFLLVGMLGVWLVDLAGLGNYNVKLAVLLANLVGGVLLGLGFGMTGYCPGTGLACAATGRLDAVVSVAGMLAGALGFLLLSPWIVPALESVWDYGETTLPEITATPQAVWVLPLAALGSVLLWLTRPLAGGADRPRARR